MFSVEESANRYNNNKDSDNSQRVNDINKTLFTVWQEAMILKYNRGSIVLLLLTIDIGDTINIRT